MGTDLIIISNHCIDYAEFDFDRLGREVAARLNQTRLQNPEFYWLSRVYWEDVAWGSTHQDAQRLLVPWTFYDDEYHRTGFYDKDSWMRGQLSFSGPFEWEVTMEPGRAELSLLPFRYLGWVAPSEANPQRPLRTAYRKALAMLVRSLGGTEVAYMADNSHPLSVFWEVSDYVAMRQDLLEQLGLPLTSFNQMEKWQETRLNKTTGNYEPDRAYLVDDFSDLDWSEPIALPPYLLELRDKTGLSWPNHAPPAP